MRKVFLILVASFLSVSAFADAIRLRPGAVTDLSNCAADGSTTTTLTVGEYLLTTKDAASNICYASTCASSGQYLPVDSMVHVKVTADTSVSCRSSTATADVQFARVN
jgi:hypothetical protein